MAWNSFPTAEVSAIGRKLAGSTEFPFLCIGKILAVHHELGGF